MSFILPELLEGVNIEQNQAHKYTVIEHNLRALQHAADNVGPGDYVIVQPGKYWGFNLTTDGKADGDGSKGKPFASVEAALANVVAERDYLKVENERLRKALEGPKPAPSKEQP